MLSSVNMPNIQNISDSCKLPTYIIDGFPGVPVF